MEQSDILVTEDNAVNQFMLTRFLERTGHSYRVANNGQEAVTAFKNKRPALILMDVQMPVMDGLEAAQEIRKLEAGSGLHTPIIAITARAQSDDEQHCKDAGMDDYISKPMRMQTLVVKLAQWLPPSAA